MKLVAVGPFRIGRSRSRSRRSTDKFPAVDGPVTKGLNRDCVNWLATHENACFLRETGIQRNAIFEPVGLRGSHHVRLRHFLRLPQTRRSLCLQHHLGDGSSPLASNQRGVHANRSVARRQPFALVGWLDSALRLYACRGSCETPLGLPRAAESLHPSLQRQPDAKDRHLGVIRLPPPCVNLFAGSPFALILGPTAVPSFRGRHFGLWPVTRFLRAG
jgi:hypothetical protein